MNWVFGLKYKDVKPLHVIFGALISVFLPQIYFLALTMHGLVRIIFPQEDMTSLHQNKKKK